MTTRRRLFALALALLAAGVGPVATRAEEQANTLQANTLMDLRRVIGACLDGAPIAAGSRVTIAFMMKRDGSIFGRPRITYAHLDGDADAQGRFLAEVERAVDSLPPRPGDARPRRGDRRPDVHDNPRAEKDRAAPGVRRQAVRRDSAATIYPMVKRQDLLHCNMVGAHIRCGAAGREPVRRPRCR